MPNNGGMEHITPVDKASRMVGGLSALANIIGVSAPTVHEWKTGKRPVPVLRCVSISQATNGEVTLQELRPDDWQKIWPELAAANATQAHEATQQVA